MCRVSGNLIATFLVVLAINFHGETKFSAENLFGKAITHNHKKFYFSRRKRRERIIWIEAIILLISSVVFASFFATLASHANVLRASSSVQEVKRTSAYEAITNVAIVVAWRLYISFKRFHVTDLQRKRALEASAEEIRWSSTGAEEWSTRKQVSCNSGR